MVRALLVGLLVAPVTAGAAPGILLPPSLGRTDVVWIAGRALREAPRTTAPAAPVNNIWALAAPNWEGAEVEVRFLGRTARAIAGHDGEFEVEIRAAPGAPFPPGAQLAEVRVPGARAVGAVHVVAPDAPYLLVSDFDDTIAVTNVGNKREMLEAALLEDAETQPAVPGMAALYRCLAAVRPAPGMAVVSGSPAQFAPRIRRFLEKNGFPPAALFLRNLGPKTLHGYKEPVLRRLAERFPQPFVLVGDSGEKDPEIYATFAREHPGRFLRIYVRRAGPPGPEGRFAGELLFADPADAARDAAGRGLAGEACVAEAFPAAAPRTGPAGEGSAKGR